MTRYTRLGKSTHQRVCAESTNWDELKATPAKEKNSSRKGREQKRERQGNSSGGNRDRSFKRKHMATEEVSANFTELGQRNKEEGTSSQNKKVKGFGKSKVVQIFGQFWVPADDAKRLQGLVKQLREKGLSRKEILAALQTERRRAEKAAKRIRDKTCYGCRQFGHVLSDCPNVTASKTTSSGDPADALIEQEPQGGICFKCGTTEHTSRNCKKKGDKFNFAKCFICSKVGHISRQCPENTRGIYPTGGECNVCKELTHLAKDCPSAVGASPALSSKSKRGATEEQDANPAVMAKVSDPFASTEYEPDTGPVVAEVKAKKRRVKF